MNSLVWLSGLFWLAFFLTAFRLVGECVSSSLFSSPQSAVGKTFVGFAALSSLASLAYCTTSLPIDILLLGSTLLSVAAVTRGSLSSLAGALRGMARMPNLPIVAAGIAVAAVMSWPVVANMHEVSRNGGVLLAHLDLFTHASFINQVAFQDRLGNTQILNSGTPAMIYHYGLYVFPAFLVKYAHWEALDILVYLIFPVGIFVTWSALSDIAKCIGSNSSIDTATTTLAALLAADASRALFFSNPLFDLPYLFAASPGAVYGLNIVLYYAKDYLESRKVNISGSIFGLFLLIGFRVHFVPVFVLLSGLVALLFSRAGATLKFLVVAATVLGCALFQFWINGPIREYYNFMVTFCERNVCLDFGTAANSGAHLALAVVFSTLGGTLILLVVLLVVTRKWKRSDLVRSPAFQLLTCVVLAYFCAIEVAITPKNNDITELIHRPFLVMNVLSAILIVGLLFRWIKRKAICALILAALTVNSIAAGRPYGFPKDHDWHQLSYRLPIAAETIKIAHWLRENPQKLPYVILPINTESYGFHPESIITALSGAPAFISRPGAHLNGTDLEHRAIQRKLEYLGRRMTCEIGEPGDIVIVDPGPVPQCVAILAIVGPYKIYR